MDAKPVILSWSGGKDSSLALHALVTDPALEVVGLLTVVTAGYDRISMHGVRRSLLERQAASVGLPLEVVEIDPHADNSSYESRMGLALEGFRSRGIETVAFGDLFLDDVRDYREQMMARAEMSAIFPIWGSDTTRLATEFVDRGFRAIVTCVDTHQLAAGFAGRWLDHDFFADLPPGVDPCGENGEFHTFVAAGPVLSREIPITTGEHQLTDDRFHFCDLLPL